MKARSPWAGLYFKNSAEFYVSWSNCCVGLVTCCYAHRSQPGNPRELQGLRRNILNLGCSSHLKRWVSVLLLVSLTLVLLVRLRRKTRSKKVQDCRNHLLLTRIRNISWLDLTWLPEGVLVNTRVWAAYLSSVRRPVSQVPYWLSVSRNGVPTASSSPSLLCFCCTWKHKGGKTTDKWGRIRAGWRVPNRPARVW